MQPIPNKFITRDVSWKDTIDYCNRITRSIPCPDVILAVTSGGVIPAAFIARNYNMYNIQYIGISGYDGKDKKHLELYYEPNLKGIDTESRILIVDDILDTGRTFQFIENYLKKRNYNKLMFSALHYKQLPAIMQYTPDGFVFGVTCTENTWIKYEWEQDD